MNSVEEQAVAAPTKGRLVVKRAGAETSDQFEFVSGATVGRFDPSVGPVDIDLGDLPEGAYVSRRHARFVCDDGVWSVRDLGSSNGTFILRDDFERVEEAQLSDGDEIALGNARFIFHIVHESSEPEAVAPTEEPVEAAELAEPL